MLYNSLQFLLFYIIITILYWFIPNRYRWILLLAGSCYFYMVFVPVYILILGFTIVIDYIAGIYLERTKEPRARKLLLILSLVANIGILVFFKYFNFLNGALDDLLGMASSHTPLPYLTILLPIGLSFHTFQAMSYTIEVYRGNYKAERHFGIYALYVMFYPQLVAGPIERPQNVLWQFHEDHKFSFENLKSGLMQMAFGLFKKVVIADRIATIVDKVYSDPQNQNGKTFLIVSILYSFQIYCDFSGYSDIGIGAARTMGYKLISNFNNPYIARSISGFWGRWHMSLSTWFRDYLYIPLGGNRVKPLRKYMNSMIVFLVSGFWHGANWTFVLWGALHGVFISMENVWRDVTGTHKKPKGEKSTTPFLLRVLQSCGIFLLVTLAWIFFRSPTIDTALAVLSKIFSPSITGAINYDIINKPVMIFSFLLAIFLLLKESFMMEIPTRNTPAFFVTISLILACCYVFGVFSNEQFIYFQF